MIRVIVFCFLVAVALAQPLSYQDDSQENMDYFLYEDENGNIQTEYLDDVETNFTAAATDIVYYFYSKTNNGVPIHSNKVKALSSTAFTVKKETIFIIHGWKNSHESDVNSKIREIIIRSHDINVFVVDWGVVAGRSYVTAQGSVRQVGQFVGAFVKELQSDFGLNINKVKFVGHSLGAHVSGCAGAALNGQVDRIVGLDPAGPLFKSGNKDNRIHSGCAKYVEIIHTNGGKLGYLAECGNSDYYPNGGKVQPGCGTDLTGSCSHARAYAFYAESLASTKFVSEKCDSYNNYVAKKCKGSHSSMGMFNVDKGASGSYYLTTNSASPYAKS